MGLLLFPPPVPLPSGPLLRPQYRGWYWSQGPVLGGMKQWLASWTPLSMNGGKRAAALGETPTAFKTVTAFASGQPTAGGASTEVWYIVQVQVLVLLQQGEGFPFGLRRGFFPLRL